MRRFALILHQRRYMDGKYAYEEMLNLIREKQIETPM